LGSAILRFLSQVKTSANRCKRADTLGMPVPESRNGGRDAHKNAYKYGKKDIGEVTSIRYIYI